MRVLVPDLPEFHALSQPGEHGVVGVDIDFYARGNVPNGPADGVVLWFADRATREQLVQVPGLRWMLTLTAGIDHIKSLLPAGVQLFNANRLHDRAVAVHVVAGMLAASRGLQHFRDMQQRGEWRSPATPAASGLTTLEGQKVVIWGYGHIGRLVEAMLAPFGAKVYGLRSKTEPDLVEYRLAEADWLVLLLPSTPQTVGLVNAGLLARLKPGVWLCNAGRGDVVMTDDLLAALESGHLAGAVLDVTDPEPLPAGHPLWSQPNVLVTPHVASTTRDLVERGAKLTRDFLLDLTQGREPEGKIAAKQEY